MMGQPDAAALEAAAALLEASQDYRVLRRLQPRAPVTGIPEQDTRVGLFVDVETTGLDPSKDEIIELAMVPLRYSLEGIIVDVGEAFDRLREPSAPIPASITALAGTSITKRPKQTGLVFSNSLSMRGEFMLRASVWQEMQDRAKNSVTNKRIMGTTSK